jgi:hypothetical protein
MVSVADDRSELVLTPDLLQQWRRSQRKLPEHLPSAVAWAVLTLVAAGTGDVACSVAAPCFVDWLAALAAAVTLAMPVVLLWSPPAGELLAPVAAALMLGAHFQPLEPLVLLTGAAAFAVTGAGRRARRARLRRWEEGARHLPVTCWPGPEGTRRLRAWGAWVGATLIATSSVLAVGGVWGVRDEIRDEAAAERRAATVTGWSGDRLVVELDDPMRRFHVDARRLSEHPVGSVREVLLVDGGARLVAEPHDGSRRVQAAAVLGLFGMACVCRSSRVRRECRAVLHGPQPNFRVRLALVRPAAPEPAVVVLGADDVDAAGPAAACIDLGVGGDVADWPAGRSVPAVLHGVPRAGAVVGVTPEHLPSRRPGEAGTAWLGDLLLRAPE